MRRTVNASHRAALALWMAVAGLALLAKPPVGASAADSSAWYWQNPLPRGYFLSGSVACVSVTSCIATEANGSVKLTADGGAHWTDVPRATPVPLGNITCPGPTICYGLGSVSSGTGASHKIYFEVFKSVDAGKTWQQPSSRLPTSPNQYVSGLVCPSVSTCLTESGGSSSPSILRTGDGGTSWHTVKMPSLQSVASLTCATARVCYADGWLPPPNRQTPPKFALIRSADGGKIWKMIGKPATSFAFGALQACLGPDTCIAIEATCFTCGDDLRESDVTFQQRETESVIYLTRDGGVTWKQAARVTNSDVYNATCPDATTCYLLGDRSVIRTTDGGKTWSVRPLVTFGAYGMACPAPTTCYVAASYAVLKTGDGFDHTEETLAHSGVHNFLGSLSCPSTTACYAVGPGGLAATSDGGTTWADKPPPPDQFGRLSCPSLTVCYAIAMNPINPDGPVAIYRSGDGAETWRRLTPPAGAIRPGDIDCVSVTTCYATAALLGNNGHSLVVLATHNSGASWSAKTGIDAAAWAGKPAMGPLSPDRLSCPSPTTCFVMASAFPGPPGSPPTIMVLSTANGGKSWTRHVLISKTAIRSETLPPGLPLACPTVTTCYAITANQTPGAHQPLPGIVLVTDDAGATWRHSVVKAKATFTDISCAGARACRVIGSAGIFATADGGKTWQRQNLADGEPFPLLQGLPSGISCPAVDTCYAVNGVMIVGTHPPGQPTP